MFYWFLCDYHGCRDLSFVASSQRRELFLIMVSEAMDAMDRITGKSRLSLGQMFILN